MCRVNWGELEGAAPQITGPGERRLEETRVALLGTLRSDGSPRISPIEPHLSSGHLLFGAMAWSLKVRDLAKLGELYLRGGRWRGRQLVPERWVRVSTRAHVATDDTLVGYGYLWWIGKQPNSFAAIGYGGQMVSVLPAQDLVVVVTADPSPPPDTRRLLRLVRLAVRG